MHKVIHRLEVLYLKALGDSLIGFVHKENSFDHAMTEGDEVICRVAFDVRIWQHGSHFKGRVIF